MPVAPAFGLTASDLDAIAALERRAVGHDGGRLKLEWNRLRSRSGERAEDVLAWSDDGRLVGFAGLYGYGAAIEIAGMVDPAERRQGLGGALLDAALALCSQAGVTAPLLIVARESAGGRALAATRGGDLNHSEHALVLRGEPTDGPSDPGITLRPAQVADVAGILRVLSAGFGFAPADLGDRLVEPGVRTLVIERDDELVGTMRVRHEGSTGGVWGFAVDPAWRGQGIGRDALRRACRQLREQGATQIGLEVEVENDRALGLYTSLGFTPVVTEDYWRR
jgi:ribosomal protein S18 acetylase RimI-like enzyme